jgi:hypothetical protein
MRGWLAVLIVAVLARTAAADADADEQARVLAQRAKLTQKAIKIVTKAGKCSSKAPKWWCVAAKWNMGTAAALPVGRPFVGVWLWVKDGKVEDMHRPLVLVATDDKGTTKIDTASIPGGEERDAAIADAVASTIEGKTTVATLGADVVKEIRGLAGKWPIAKLGDDWYWDERSDDVRLRKIGAYWVAILAPPPAAARSYPDGRMFMVFTDAWK